MAHTILKRMINSNNPEKEERFIIIAEVSGVNGLQFFTPYTGDKEADEAKCMAMLEAQE
jgi:hypothetical protein